MGKAPIPTPTYYHVINAFLTHTQYNYVKHNSPTLFISHFYYKILPIVE